MKEIILIKIKSDYIDQSGKPWDSYEKLVYDKEELESSIKKFEIKKKKVIDQKQKELDQELLKGYGEKAEKLIEEISYLDKSEIVYYEFSEEKLLDILSYESDKSDISSKYEI